jgi:glycerol-3-phosphate O-acyltransferase
MTLHSRLAAEGLAVLVACSALGFERLATLAVLAAVVWARYQALTRGPQRDAQLFERVHPILAAVFAEKEAAEAKRKGTSPGEELVELRSLVELFAERKKDAESPPSPPKRKDGLSFPAVEEVRAAVCKDPQVVAAMQKTGQEVGAVLRILDKMQSTPSERVFQIVAFVIQRFLGLIFSLGVHIAEDDVQRLRDAEATGNPIVLLPTHRSHVDYCVTSLFLYVNGLRMPYVVAGENLNQPVLGKVLRSCGAFFIKRSFGGDVLYGTVFNAYVRALLQRKITVECFVEGGRTRTGKLLQPKAGFLRTAVECVQNEEVSDVLVVPVSIVYDRVIEGSAYAMEQSGGTKQKEAILTIIGGWWNLFRRRVLTFSTFGSVVVTVAAERGHGVLVLVGDAHSGRDARKLAVHGREARA